MACKGKLLCCSFAKIGYEVLDDMRYRCLSSTSMVRAVSPYAFNVDFVTQIALTLFEQSRFRFLVFMSGSMENNLSASAFEFGRLLMEFNNSCKHGYLRGNTTVTA